MINMRRARNGFLTVFTLLFTFIVWLPQAQAFSSFLNNFNTTYGTAGTRLDTCSTCHVSESNFSFNPYGSDFRDAGSLTAIESLDSDGDGFTNIDEIVALTFPGNSNDPPPPVNQAPVADPNGPYTGTVGNAIQFDGSASSDPEGAIASYDWDFGDGATGNGATPTHTYTETGTFTVTLSVTDDGGLSDTATTTATVGLGNQAPVANPNGPYSGTVGSAVQFDGSGSSDPDGTIVSYDWEFGDGVTGTGISPTHTYAAAGNYNVTLTVMDDSGATDSAGTTASIGTVNQPPVANANGPYNGTVSVPVTFNGTGSNDPDGTIVGFDWDFGDGTVAVDAGPTPSHTYSADGSYTVTLTVTDDAGASATDATTANIGAVVNQPPTADPNGPYSGTVNVPVQFDGTASDDADGTIVAYEWNFGDGTTGTGATPTHSYSANGTFTVSLTVTDDADATDTATTTATIGLGNQPPTADANGPYTGTVGIAVQFDGTGSSDPEGGSLAYDWNFGDGSVGVGVNPTHTYTSASTFNVTLTVTDDAGATDSDMTTATIVAASPPPAGDANLEIDEMDVDRRYRLGQREALEVELEVRNTGTVEESRMATVVGTQNGVVVYRESMMVSAPAGGLRSRDFDFPDFRPSQSGDIAWVATIAPNVDQATTTTDVQPPGTTQPVDDDDDDNRNRGRNSRGDRDEEDDDD